MQNPDFRHMVAFYGAILPLCILVTENDEDREFLTDVYLQYKPLMFKVACQYFGDSMAEVDDAIGSAVEHLCKKSDTFKGVTCNKRASYIVSMVRNACLTRLRELKRQRLYCDYGPSSEALEAVAGTDNVEEMVFYSILVSDLLTAFPELNEKDRELIRMRHIDQLDYTQIAALVGSTEAAARTAVSRAKSRLEQLAMKMQG